MKSCLKQPIVEDGSESSGTTTNSASKLKSFVGFGDVHVYQFPLTLGDNPHCEGAPTTLDWTPSETATYDLDLYEYSRPQGSSTGNSGRRKKSDFRIPHVEREIYLLSLGFSMNDILLATEQGRKVRKERYQSFHNKKWDRFNTVLESARKKFQVSAKSA